MRLGRKQCGFDSHRPHFPVVTCPMWDEMAHRSRHLGRGYRETKQGDSIMVALTIVFWSFAMVLFVDRAYSCADQRRGFMYLTYIGGVLLCWTVLLLIILAERLT